MAKYIDRTGRQHRQAAITEIDYDGGYEDGVAFPVLGLPPGAIPLEGYAEIIEAGSEALSTMAIGLASGAALAASVALDGAAGTVTDFDGAALQTAIDNSDDVIVTSTGADGATAGKVRIVLEFLQLGAADLSGNPAG